ncbi:SIMPL domain-containing protein [Pseudoalteromonas pernae]|uniref:SIMPL domain-containing protein n=1 Tax=Pseudoalteromonas pernae TaxID=3118054 RepID=UPI003242A8C3
MKYISIIALLAFSCASIANNSLPNNRHIAVTGTAQLEAKPDLAVVQFEVQSLKAKSIDAKKDVDNRVNDFLAGLSRFAINEDNVSASSLSTQPVYTYDDNDKQQLEGYSANRRLKVTLGDLTKLNDLMDFALSVRIDEIESVTLKSSDEDAIKDEVNALAVKNAKDKGTSLANAFGAKLGHIYSINSNSNNSYYRYGANSDIERIEVTGSRMKSKEPGRYLQENIVFTSTINVVFDLVLN